jgi:hypothetical protein
MQPTQSQITIDLQTLTPIGRLAYRIDGVENNPTLELIRGYTYTLLVTAADPYQLWIKSGLGLGSSSSYNTGINGNGQPEMIWRVAEDAPNRLAYQAYGSTEVSGCIAITSAPPTASVYSETYASVQQALDFLQESLCFSPKNIAGQGLTLDGSTLKLLEPSLRYLTDSNGALYTQQSTFTISDDPVWLTTPPTDLQSWINYLAATLRRLKGVAYNQTSPTIPTLNGRIDDLVLEIRYLLTKI